MAGRKARKRMAGDNSEAIRGKINSIRDSLTVMKWIISPDAGIGPDDVKKGAEKIEGELDEIKELLNLDA